MAETKIKIWNAVRKLIPTKQNDRNELVSGWDIELMFANSMLFELARKHC